MISEINILALGDSLTEGFGVQSGYSYPVGLSALLRKKGLNCKVINAGYSGDTCRNLMARMDRSLDIGPDFVILEIGLNDILMGAMPGQISRMITTIAQRITARAIPVILAGMVLPAMGDAETEKAFAALYPAVAQNLGLTLLPSFNAPAMETKGGVQLDGIHPTVTGYAAIVSHILPWVISAL